MSTISVGLSATVLPFKAQMVAAGEAVSVFATEVQAAAVKSNKAVTAVAAGMAAVGVAAVAMAAVSVKSAVDMETRMQNVATIWTDTGTSVAQAGQQIIEMSRQLPQSANNLAEGLYQVASSGFQGAAGMQVLEAAATAASAGLTTTAVAATGITAVLNAYGMTASQASKVSDVLFQTVNLGVVTFEQLSNTLGDFVGIASVAGISIEDAAAAFATMTLSGLNASEAGTAVSRAIQAIIQPSKEMAATLAAAGYASGQAALDALGLKGTVELLTKATGGSATAMGILVPEMRAYKGILALASADGANYTRVQGDMNDQSKLLGATQAALAEQAKSTSFQFGIFKNTVAAVGIEFGQALLPVIKPLIGLFQSLADTFMAIPGPLQAILIGGALLAAVVVGLAGAFLLLAPSIAAATTLIGGSTVAMGALTTAFWALDAAMPVIGLIGAALAIATPFVVMWAKSHGDAKRQVDDLAKSLDQETAALTDSTAASITDTIVKQKLNGAAATVGVSLDTLTAAMLGNKDAIDKVHAATALTADEQAAYNDRLSEGITADYGAVDAKTKLRTAVDGGNAALGKAVDQTKAHAAVQDAATKATEVATGITDAQAQANLDLDASYKELAKSLAEHLSVTSVLTAATAAYATAQTAITATDKAALDQRQQVEKDAQTQTQKIEKDSLDVRNQATKDALAVKQKTEVDALALAQRTVTDALDARFRAETDAYDRDARARKDALDAQQRAEQDALDDRLALLDDEYDAKKKAENRAYQAEVDRVQALIDSTFGDEREGHKADLTALEDAHDARLTALDQSKTVEVRTIKEGVDDKQQAEKEGLDDTLLAVKEGITDRQQAEKQAADDAYTAKVNALKTLQDTEDTALGVALKALSDNLDLQQQAVTRQLENRQTADDNAADARRASAAAKHVLTLADLQKQFDAEKVKYDKFNEDLAVIASRGGADVIAEVAKLDPAIVAEAAKAGPGALTALLESIRVGLASALKLPVLSVTDIPGIGGINRRAAGGPVLPGVPYLVGEDGPEVRVFDQPGSIVPVSRWTQAAGAGVPAGSGGGGAPTISMPIHIEVQARVDAGIDMGTAGAAITKQIRFGIEGAFDELERRVTTRAWRN